MPTWSDQFNPQFSGAYPFCSHDDIATLSTTTLGDIKLLIVDYSYYCRMDTAGFKLEVHRLQCTPMETGDVRSY